METRIEQSLSILMGEGGLHKAIHCVLENSGHLDAPRDIQMTQEFDSFFTEITVRLRYRAQPVNAVWENSRCLL
jgi:hypothetical protein